MQDVADFQSNSVSDLSRMKNDMPEYIAFKSTLLYSASILILPILSFFLSKIIVFDGIFSHNLVTSNICSAACSVLVLHIALGIFIYKAYAGNEKTTKKD
ncbi:hypothetical protein PGB90_008736 [Kerria lacca]